MLANASRRMFGAFAHGLPNPPPPGVSMTMTSSRATGARERRAEMLDVAVGALDPVAAGRAGLAARDAERRHAPVVRQHHRGHGLEESHAPFDAVAAAMSARAARAAPDAEGLEPHRKAPLEHFGIREPRVGHVSLHGVGAVEVRARRPSRR